MVALLPLLTSSPSSLSPVCPGTGLHLALEYGESPGSSPKIEPYWMERSQCIWACVCRINSYIAVCAMGSSQVFLRLCGRGLDCRHLLFNAILDGFAPGWQIQLADTYWL